MIPARRTDPTVPAQPAKPSGSGEKAPKSNPILLYKQAVAYLLPANGKESADG